MTLDDALALPPGRELDAAVAVRVLGISPRKIRLRGTADHYAEVWTNNPYYADGQCNEHELFCVCDPPHYSTDLTIAYELVQAAIDAGEAPYMVRDGYEGQWDASMDAAGEWSASAPALPHAIVRAALRWKWREET